MFTKSSDYTVPMSDYKINFSMATKICHKFLKMSKSLPIPDVIAWIERNLRVDKTEERHFM